MALPRVPVTDVTVAVPAPFGILSPAATVIEDSSPHWTAGFEYESLDCGTTVRISSICTAATGVTQIAGDPDDRWRSYHPFVIETSFECTTFGGLDYEEYARKRLEACQQKSIEREFWTGELAKQEDAANGADAWPNRYLASTNATDVTPTAGTPVKPKYGLALLEQALADCGCGVLGTIHTTRGTASALGLAGADATLMTTLGNRVIAGSGYTGTGPNGSAPAGTAAWMYATGPLTVRLGSVNATPDTRAQSVNTSNNSVKVYADRAAAVTWDTCCHFAVLVDLALDYS